MVRRTFQLPGRKTLRVVENSFDYVVEGCSTTQRVSTTYSRRRFDYTWQFRLRVVKRGSTTQIFLHPPHRLPSRTHDQTSLSVAAASSRPLLPQRQPRTHASTACLACSPPEPGAGSPSPPLPFAPLKPQRRRRLPSRPRAVTPSPPSAPGRRHLPSCQCRLGPHPILPAPDPHSPAPGPDGPCRACRAHAVSSIARHYSCRAGPAQAQHELSNQADTAHEQCGPCHA